MKRQQSQDKKRDGNQGWVGVLSARHIGGFAIELLTRCDGSFRVACDASRDGLAFSHEGPRHHADMGLRRGEWRACEVIDPVSAEMLF
jgi:hypothetical protein